MTFYFNNNAINIKHVPNVPTDGDVIVHFTNSNVLHLGDIISDTFFSQY